MGQIASWNNHSFTVSPALIRGFTGLTIIGASEVEEKTSSSQNYVYRKNGAPSEVALVAELNAMTGCDVKNEALKFVEEAHAGAQAYFYIGGKKLLTCQLMLTEAEVSEVAMTANGAWISCKVALTMLQCSKMDGTKAATTTTTATSSTKTSVKTTSTVSTSTKKATSDAIRAAKTDPTTISNIMGWGGTTASDPLAKQVGQALAKLEANNANAKAATASTNTTAKAAGTSALPKLSVGSKNFSAIALGL